MRDTRRRAERPTTGRDQVEQVWLRDNDPVSWLRDKAERRVPIDSRGPENAAAVLKVCALAESRLHIPFPLRDGHDVP